ncbi:MAG TPA: ATPase, T2SS/T4P/T4SS family [Longimicrobiales bacterium]|nr:ATPase, T2SS/T4P/T4SS family [Longimicrobiales bacterium]
MSFLRTADTPRSPSAPRPSTAPQRSHRFGDEWLLTLVSGIGGGVTEEPVAEWRRQGRRFLSQALVGGGVCSFEELGEAIRGRYRIRYEAPDPATLDRSLLSLVPERTCRKHGVVPRALSKHTLSILTANPIDPEAQQEVEWASIRGIEPICCLPDHLDRLLHQMLAPDAVVFDLLARLQGGSGVELLGSGPDDELGGEALGEVRAPVIRLANAIIADAVARNASDIHVEHDEHASVVRYRVDGLLRKAMVLPRYVGTGSLVSRVKIMAGLDLAERWHPQDGRAKLRVGEAEIGLRVSTLPTRLGEKIVIRVLDERTAAVPLEGLGLDRDVQLRLESLLRREEGVLLVTGPTGSGKTTTLYAMLNRLRGDQVNLVTVEDPVEYRLPGVNQVQVHERQGLTFPAVLRSVLRQDPDVIMVGEIRDQETADVACQAALTGHLVLSTLHTNDAVTSIARLADMGVERFKLAGRLLGATVQRLVRRVCAAGADAEEIRGAALEGGLLHTLTEDALHHIAAAHTTYEEVAPHLAVDAAQARGARCHDSPSRRRRPAGRSAGGRGGDGGRPAGGRDAAGRQGARRRGGRGCRRAQRSRFGALLAWGGQRLLRLAACGDGRADAYGSRALPGRGTRGGRRGGRTREGRPGPHGHAGSTRPRAHLDAGRGRRRPGCRGGRLPAPSLAAGRYPGPAARDPPELEPVVGPRGGRAPQDPVQRAAAPGGAALPRGPRHPPEERLDALTREAAAHFAAPIAMVSLVDADRQWFKSKLGVENSGTPRDIAFCAHAILGDDVFVVEDAFLDPRFADNPLVTGDPGARFYAGYPLRGPEGHHIGSFCVVDRKPRSVSPADVSVLVGLGRRVEAELWRGRGA